MTNEEFQALAQRVVDANIPVKRGTVAVARYDRVLMVDVTTYEEGHLVGTHGWSVRGDSEYVNTNPNRKGKTVAGWRVSSPTGFGAGLYSTRQMAVRVARVFDFICGDAADNATIMERICAVLGHGERVLDAARFVGYEEDTRKAAARKAAAHKEN